MKHQCSVWCPASAMSASIRLVMLVEFSRVLQGNPLHNLMCDFFHACQVMSNFTPEAQIYPSFHNATIASFSLNKTSFSPQFITESRRKKREMEMKKEPVLKLIITMTNHVVHLSFLKMTVSLQTFAISKRLELETSA